MFFSRFLKDRRGGVAPMFGLAIVPVFGLVGAAVDYSRANAIKASLQAALDATTLAMAKLAPTLTESELQTKTTAVFTAQFNNLDTKTLTVTPKYTTGGGPQLTISASATMDTAFMKLLGYSTLNVGSSSTVKWGNSRLRVALALDNTGSMNDDGKIGALKTATKGLLDQLKAAATNNGDVYVSIIPFSRNVNADSSNYNQSWVDFVDHPSYVGWDKNNGTCSNNNFPTYDDCISKKKDWTPNNHSTWNGCVTDRDKPYDTSGNAPTSDASTKFPAEQYGSCPVAVKGLSYDWTSMATLVNSMTAAGTTNQTIGLVWAWMSLFGGGPFTVPTMDAGYKYQQTIMLMSDGLNTQNRWDGDGKNVSAQVDARMSLACDDAKTKAGITIYTVHVNTKGDPMSQVLRNCATSPDHFFTVTSSGQMSTVFNQIGSQLSQLRIAK